MTIPASQKGVLQNDIACGFYCSGDPSIACEYNDEEDVCFGHGFCVPEQIVLGRGATLYLDGHEITPAYQAAGVHCGIAAIDKGRCTVTGPGTIAGGKGWAVAAPSGMDIIVKNITVGGFDASFYTTGRLKAEGLVVPNDRENAIQALKGATIRSSQLDGAAGLLSDGDVRLIDVQIGPSHGGDIVAGRRFLGRNLIIHGDRGINARDIAIKQAISVPGTHDQHGSYASATRRLRLIDSEVVNIESGKKPVLVRSECAKSTVYGTSETWGVCTED